MDRSREVRRGPPMANGFLRRRPQRNGGGGGMRDSPEEGMAGELPDSAAVRLRDRKKDRLNRHKRRRGERLHGNREEGGEESSEESVDVDDDEDDEEEEATAAANLRRTVQPPVMKIVKPQWKVTDEMIGVPVPRKARSVASVKRSHETSVSGSGERCPDQIPVQRPSSTSPATPSPAAVSPSSSNASIRRRVKPVGAKQKPAKASKISIQEEIEIEVAEVLFGLRQHPTASANPETSIYTSSPKVEPKEEESSTLAGKPRVISPQQPLTLPRISGPTAVSISSAVATQKRKRPRPGKSEEEKSSCAVTGVAPIGAPAVVATTNDMEKMEASSSPKQQNDCGTAAVNGVDRALKAEISRDAVKPHLVPETKPPSADGEPETKRIPVSAEKIEPKEEPTSTAKLEIDLDGSAKGVSLVPKVSDVLKEERFQIDLMAPPSKTMMDGEINGDSVMEIETMNMKDDIDTAERKEELAQMEQEVAAKAPGAEKRAEASEGCDATALSSERMLDPRLDAEKSDMEGGKQQNQKHSRAARTDPKALEVEKSAAPSSGAAGATAGPSSLPLGMHLAGWPGGLPPIGYIGQAPANWPGAPPLHAMVPMEGNSGAPPTRQPHVLLPQPRYKRCATHCYIAQMINYYQQLARINPYWAAASNASLFGAKVYNLNAIPSTEGMILSNTLPGGAFPAVNFAAATRTPSSVQEKGSGGAVNLGSHTSKEKASASLKQQPGTQQPTHPASAPSIPQGAAVLFPLNQVAETGRPGGIKAPVAGNAAIVPAQVGGAMGSTGPVGMATVSYNFANLPTNDAQYIAMVQGSGFPFPIPAHVGVAAAATAASSYRGSTQGGQQGTAPGAAVPPPPQQFFNGSFYASHVLHPAQVQQAQSQAFQQQGQQNPANSSGSSSSQKHHHHHHHQRLQGSGNSNSRQPQQQRTPSQSPGSSLHPNHRTSGSSQPRQGESEAGHAHGDGDSSTMADSKVSPLQKSLYTPNNHLHQTLNPGYGISPVAVPMIMPALGGGKNGEKQPQNSEAHLHYGLKGMELMPSQAFAMSFAPGVDFSMASGHHAVFHSLPESYRQNYQLSTAQAVAVAAAAQQQHAQRTAAVQKIGEDAKNTTDTVGGPPTRQEDRKASSGKPAPPISSHSLTFSRQPENNNENSSISIFSSSSTHVTNQEAILDNSSRTMNLSSNPANGRPPSSATSTGQQQHHHQPAISHSRAANNVGVSPVSMQSAVAISYPDRLLGSKFSGSLSALPQALVQGGAAPQSPQWRSTAGGAPSSRTPAPASAPSPPKQTKNSAGAIGPGSSSTAPTQISFGSSAVNPKVTAMSMTGHMPANSSLNGNPSIASPASVRLNSSSTLQVVSPPTSITKSTAGASTRVSTGSKGVVVPATSPTISQQNKSTPSSTSRKHSPPVGGRSNLPSILGHPQLGQGSSPKQPLPQQQPLAQSSNLKHQQQLSQQHQKPQFHQAQMLFANTYPPAQSLPPLTAAAAAAAATAGYYQTRAPSAVSLSYQPQRRTASEQQPQQNFSSPASSNPVATGVVSLGPSSLVSASDSLKSGGANGSSLNSSTGSLPPHPFSTSSSAATNSGNHPNAASVVMAAFPYIHAVSTAPLKSAEQNSAAGKHKQEKIQ